MNRIVLLIISIGLFIYLGCGKKGDPKYLDNNMLSKTIIEQQISNNR